MMALENSPEEKAKMDLMMEKLAGITVGSTDSLATTENVTDSQKKPEIKSVNKEKDDRKLVGNDPIVQMNNDLGSDPEPNPLDMQDSGQMPPMSGDYSSPGKDRSRNLNFGSMMDGNMGSSDMEMANMKSSFDDLHSVPPGTGGLDLDTGSDSLGSIDSGLHETATKAMINRMDQTNEERMQQLNSMFPPPSKMMPSFHKKKKSHVISIKKMLKNYPPGLVDEFMPELKHKVMHKFDQMRRDERMNRKIRKLKRKLNQEKRRDRKRRKLREKRRRRALARRRRRRLHHHHHHNRLRPKHHFRPHFSMRSKMKHQYHSIGVINNFMHRRHNHLHHLHHLKERRLEQDKTEKSSQISMVLSNETDSENQFLALEKELENGNLSKINESNASKGN